MTALSLPVLEAKGVGKTFNLPGGDVLQVLKDINFALQAGESLSLTGSSGAGKTTLLNIVAGLMEPQVGELYWQSEGVHNLSNRKLSLKRGKFLGFLFQNYCLIPELTALENVIFAGRIQRQFPLRVYKQRARELLDKVGLKQRLHHLSSQLSGGECQRVALARALISKPPLLLADEPTGNLDEHTAQKVMTLLLKLCKEEQTSLLLVTHNLSFATQTERQVHLHEGMLHAGLSTC